MAEIIRMPRLSDTMEEGVIVGWLKEVGDAVSPGDVLAEVETDKATMELESFQEGFLLYIGVKEGAVPVDGVLAVIGEKGEDFQAQLDAALQANGTETQNAEKPVETPNPAIEMSNSEPSEISARSEDLPTNGNTGGGRILASPLAKSIASESGIALQSISGTGDGGRIIKRDVEAFLQNKTLVQPETRSNQVKTSPDIEYGDHPVSQMRKTIARRLSESKFGAPHFYLTIEIDMTDSASQRAKVNAISDQKISFNDLIVKGVAMALKKHPKVNSSWFGDKITIHRDINIGVAVAVEEGLLVPVVRNADYKSLGELNSEVKSLAGKAKEKKLQLEEMQGNTFTVSNLGMFGIEEFTAIINPPDACILAIGSIIDKPVVKEGSIVVGKMMKVTLSCDHRVVDGATGAKFLQTLRMMLENPVSMMI